MNEEFNNYYLKLEEIFKNVMVYYLDLIKSQDLNENIDKLQMVLQLKDYLKADEKRYHELLKNYDKYKHLDKQNLLNKLNEAITSIFYKSWKDNIWFKYQDNEEIKELIIDQTKKEYHLALKNINNELNDIENKVIDLKLNEALLELNDAIKYFQTINENYQDVFNYDYNGNIKFFRQIIAQNINCLTENIKALWPRNEEYPQCLNRHI